MQKLITSIFMFLAFGSILLAQPGELSTPLSFQYLLDNPAATGIDGLHHIQLGTYQKWLSMEEAPKSYYLSTSHPLLKRSLGIGFTMVQDKAALLKNTRANLNVAVHLNPESIHRFSIGASARYQQTGFGIPNVDDPYLADGPTASGINLGVGLNYHYEANNGTMFNLQLQSPLLPATLELTQKGLDTTLTYQLEQALVFQANLHYPLGGGNFLTPSLRLQGQLAEEGGFSKTQVIDLGIGVSFLEDVLHFRLGYRSSQASMFYGGVGMSFGRGSQAHLLYEPTGPFGSSAALAADLVFGDPVTTTKNDIACFKSSNCLQEKWSYFNNNSFTINSTTNTGSDFTFITISFGDDSNTYFDYFAHDDFIAGIPLDRLTEAIQTLYENQLNKAGHQIVQLTLRSKVLNELEANSYETYSGEAVTLDYWQSGKPPVSETIADGLKLTEAQLAALKLDNLARGLQSRTPVLREAVVRKEVNHDPNILYNREVQIVLIIK